MSRLHPLRRHVTPLSIGWFAGALAAVIVAAVVLLWRPAFGPTGSGSPSPQGSGPSSAPPPSPSATPSLAAVASLPDATGTPPASLPAPKAEIARSYPGFSGGDALGGGTLGVEQRADAICFYVTPGDYGHARTALIWPHDFSAGGHPISIIGPDGQRLGHAGDYVLLGGGGPPGGFVPAPSQDPCGYGTTFWVSSVVSVNGREWNIGEGSLRLKLRPSGDSCQGTRLEPLMLVMVDEHLQLREISSGVDLEVTWPAGYKSRTNPIRVLAPDGRTVATQGRKSDNLRGTIGRDGVTVCG